MSLYILIKWRWQCKSSCICSVAGCCFFVIILFYFFLLSLKNVPSILLGKYETVFFWFYRKLDLGTNNVFHLNQHSLPLSDRFTKKKKGWILVRQGHNVLKECTFHSKLALHVISLIESLTTLELINTEKFLNGWLCIKWAEPRWLGAQIVCSC
jgi:hypothetical protein